MLEFETMAPPSESQGQDHSELEAQKTGQTGDGSDLSEEKVYNYWPESLQFQDEGYHKIAGIMSRHDSVTIFRKFGELNMFNLLSLQAELMELQREFVKFCKDDEKDSTDDSPAKLLQYSFFTLFDRNEKRKHDKEKFYLQRDTLLEIRKKLKEYSQCLLANVGCSSADQLVRQNSSPSRTLAKIGATFRLRNQSNSI
jgi:hypothetical protein